jgi:large subunit ribosomal protein L10
MGSNDIAAPAKVALTKAKELKKLAVKCGLVEGNFLDEEGCKTLATLPSREGLISQILGLLQAPIASFARVLNSIAEKQA